MSVSALASRSGASRRYLQTVLAAERSVGVDELDLIASHLSIKTWRLLAPLPLPDDLPDERNLDTARVLLACRIRCAATELGLTRGDVAHLAGCARSHLFEVTACRVCAGVDLFAGLAYALRVELHELLLPVDHS